MYHICVLSDVVEIYLLISRVLICMVHCLQSAIDTDKISIDADTQAMLKSLDFGHIANVELVQPFVEQQQRRRPQKDQQ